jgi:hypothetical protein
VKFYRDRVRDIQRLEAPHLRAALTAKSPEEALTHINRARPFGEKARRILTGQDGPRYVEDRPKNIDK